jgi:hypothetical protein
MEIRNTKDSTVRIVLLILSMAQGAHVIKGMSQVFKNYETRFFVQISGKISFTFSLMLFQHRSYLM